MENSISAWTIGNYSMSQRKINFPLPRIDDIPNTLVGAKWFFILDQKSVYWKIDVHPDNKEKTAFSMGQGLWQFTLMPLGLSNVPAIFETITEAILRDLTYDSCLVYLDDVIVVCRTFHEHLLNLRKVFQRFREARLKLIPESVNYCRLRYDTWSIFIT
jgi:hypothetical protein